MSKVMTAAALAAGATVLSAPAAMALSPHDTQAAAPAARVVASQIIDQSGGTLSGAVNGGNAQLSIPEGAFKEPTELRMTTADTKSLEGSLGRIGYSGYRALAAVGLKAYKVDGSTVDSKFAKPLSLTVTGSDLSEGQKAIQLNLARPQEQKASFSSGKAELSVNGTPDLVFVAPENGATELRAATSSKGGEPAEPQKPAAGTAIEGATKAETGIPLTPELVGSGLALAAGTTLLLGGGRGLRRPNNVA